MNQRHGLQSIDTEDVSPTSLEQLVEMGRSLLLAVGIVAVAGVASCLIVLRWVA